MFAAGSYQRIRASTCAGGRLYDVRSKSVVPGTERDWVRSPRRDCIVWFMIVCSGRRRQAESSSCTAHKRKVERRKRRVEKDGRDFKDR